MEVKEILLQIPVFRRLGGPHSRFRQGDGKKKTSLLLPGIEIQSSSL
jgi:hypothetical protein